MQVDPVKTTLKAPGTKHLKLHYDEPLSNFAFTFNLHHYNLGLQPEFTVLSSLVAGCMERLNPGGSCWLVAQRYVPVGAMCHAAGAGAGHAWCAAVDDRFAVWRIDKAGAAVAAGAAAASGETGGEAGGEAIDGENTPKKARTTSEEQTPVKEKKSEKKEKKEKKEKSVKKDKK